MQAVRIVELTVVSDGSRLAISQGMRILCENSISEAISTIKSPVAILVSFF